MKSEDDLALLSRPGQCIRLEGVYFYRNGDSSYFSAVIKRERHWNTFSGRFDIWDGDCAHRIGEGGLHPENVALDPKSGVLTFSGPNRERFSLRRLKNDEWIGTVTTTVVGAEPFPCRCQMTSVRRYLYDPVQFEKDMQALTARGTRAATPVVATENMTLVHAEDETGQPMTFALRRLT